MELNTMLGFLCIVSLPLVIDASLNTECYVHTDCADNYYCDPLLSLCDSCEELCSHPKQKPFCDTYCPAYNKFTTIGPNPPATVTTHTEGTVKNPQAVKSGQNAGSPYLVPVLVFAGVLLVSFVVIVLVWSRGSCTFIKTHRPIMQETSADGGPSIYKPFNNRNDVIRNPKQEQNSHRGSREELAASTARRPEAIRIGAHTIQASALAGQTDSPLGVHADMPARIHTLQSTLQSQTTGTSQGPNESGAADQLLPDRNDLTEGHCV